MVIEPLLVFYHDKKILRRMEAKNLLFPWPPKSKDSFGGIVNLPLWKKRVYFIGYACDYAIHIGSRFIGRSHFLLKDSQLI